MATSKGQRIGIWTIAVFMAIGTIGSFAIIILSNANSKSDQARYDELLAVYKSDVAAQASELSDKYFPTFSPYLSRVSAFSADNVTELGKEDLVVGTGNDITSESTFTAYYIGWNPSGKMFDSSFNEDKTALNAPFDVTPGKVIEGWTQGADGMKVGGIRELTIPSSLAYKEQGSGNDIPPNTPIKFVIMIIPTPEAIPVPDELSRLYARLYGN